jgi:hypothetical protein
MSDVKMLKDPRIKSDSTAVKISIIVATFNRRESLGWLGMVLTELGRQAYAWLYFARSFAVRRSNVRALCRLLIKSLASRSL